MTSSHAVLPWLLSRLWSVAAVFAILVAGTAIVEKYQELKGLEQTVNQLESSEDYVEGIATRLAAEAQERIEEMDRAGREALTRRMQACEQEIRQLHESSPSMRQRASALARRDSKAILGWVRSEIAVKVTMAEREAIGRILDYRSRRDEYEKQMRNGPVELERLRLEHLAASEEAARLQWELEQIRNEYPVRSWLFGTEQYAKRKQLQQKHDDMQNQAQESKAKHDALAQSLGALRKPDRPQVMLRVLPSGHLIEEIERVRGELEAELRQNWLRRFIHLDMTGLLTAAATVVALATVAPVGVKLVLFYVFAPIAVRRSAIALLPNSNGEVLNGCAGRDSASTTISSVSCRVTIDSWNELLVHPEYVQSQPHFCETRTQLILSRDVPLSSIAANLYLLTRMRAESPQTVVVSSTRDPLSEVSLVTIPETSSAVLLPRYIVGVIQTRDAPLRITRHWRVLSLHSWLTMQLRYLVFHGPITLVVKGCRGVRVEAAEAGRSVNPTATVGFSANLLYTSRRCETLFAYLSGQQPLLHDSFAGGDGYYIYQEIPDRRRRGIVGRGLEGLLDAALKPLGI